MSFTVNCHVVSLKSSPVNIIVIFILTRGCMFLIMVWRLLTMSLSLVELTLLIHKAIQWDEIWHLLTMSLSLVELTLSIHKEIQWDEIWRLLTMSLSLVELTLLIHKAIQWDEIYNIFERNTSSLKIIVFRGFISRPLVPDLLQWEISITKILTINMQTHVWINFHYENLHSWKRVTLSTHFEQHLINA